MKDKLKKLFMNSDSQSQTAMNKVIKIKPVDTTLQR